LLCTDLRYVGHAFAQDVHGHLVAILVTKFRSLISRSLHSDTAIG
jgi:hypothetical protein